MTAGAIVKVDEVLGSSSCALYLIYLVKYHRSIHYCRAVAQQEREQNRKEYPIYERQASYL